MKKVFKYGTGQVVPEGAVYLKTVVEVIPLKIVKLNDDGSALAYPEQRFVWHYFLVEL